MKKKSIEDLKNISELPSYGYELKEIQWPLRFRSVEDGNAYLENSTRENFYKYCIPPYQQVGREARINEEYRDAPIEMAVLMGDKNSVPIVFKR